MASLWVNFLKAAWIAHLGISYYKAQGCGSYCCLFVCFYWDASWWCVEGEWGGGGVRKILASEEANGAGFTCRWDTHSVLSMYPPLFCFTCNYVICKRITALGDNCIRDCLPGETGRQSCPFLVGGRLSKWVTELASVSGSGAYVDAKYSEDWPNVFLHSQI